MMQQGQPNPIQKQIQIKNIKKLIHQNKKLHAQLLHLQFEINELEGRDTEKSKMQVKAQIVPQQTEILKQQKQIRKLKDEVTFYHCSNIKQNVIYIRKQEDQLQCLRQDLLKFVDEKEIIRKGFEDKKKKLQMNLPLERHRLNIEKDYNDVKKANRQSMMHIIQLQREVRKYHRIKQSHKNGISKEAQISDFQVIGLQQEIKKMQLELKMKQQKWGPSLEALDSEYFVQKNKLDSLNNQIKQLEREEEMVRHRATALRDHSEIESDRERLSKIHSNISKQNQPFNHKTSINKSFDLASEKVGSLQNLPKSKPNGHKELTFLTNHLDEHKDIKDLLGKNIKVKPENHRQSKELISINQKNKPVSIQILSPELNSNLVSTSNATSRKQKLKQKLIASQLSNNIKAKMEQIKKINRNMQNQRQISKSASIDKKHINKNLQKKSSEVVPAVASPLISKSKKQLGVGKNKSVAAINNQIPKEKLPESNQSQKQVIKKESHSQKKVQDISEKLKLKDNNKKDSKAQKIENEKHDDKFKVKERDKVKLMEHNESKNSNSKKSQGIISQISKGRQPKIIDIEAQQKDNLHKKQKSPELKVNLELSQSHQNSKRQRSLTELSKQSKSISKKQQEKGQYKFEIIMSDKATNKKQKQKKSPKVTKSVKLNGIQNKQFASKDEAILQDDQSKPKMVIRKRRDINEMVAAATST